LVITALREKLLTLDVLSSPKKIQGIYETLQSSIKTNMTLSQLFKMAKNLSKTSKENII
jgi:anionic cell wall polymer biosynthesis LytR-Cps2A-Psr (LCP) family protein